MQLMCQRYLAFAHNSIIKLVLESMCIFDKAMSGADLHSAIPKAAENTA